MLQTIAQKYKQIRPGFYLTIQILMIFAWTQKDESI